MSDYKGRRGGLVRREGQLMEHFIQAHKNKDQKTLKDVQKHIDLNNKRLKILGPKR